jgi:hypothetical protein
MAELIAQETEPDTEERALLIGYAVRVAREFNSGFKRDRFVEYIGKCDGK